MHNDAVPASVASTTWTVSCIKAPTSPVVLLQARLGGRSIQETIEFHANAAIESAELADGVRVAHEQRMEERSLTFHRGTKACQHGPVTGLTGDSECGR
ncbi:MAG: hypothetical protein CM15mP18_4160 [Methanobacteriota archaeon]|nr:MAG: hypothetical protein CM15mP18_4160 [Euryarchaeota archaeon]